jgi:hypothetical protein
MDDPDPELFKLIRNELSLAHTFLDTYHLASSQDHEVQALNNARAAMDVAIRFVHRLTPELAEKFQPEMRDLEQSFSAIAGSKPT